MHDLVGRERELVIIDEAIQRALVGDRAVLFITGEPGIGKSRLLDEVASRAAARGSRIAWGRTAEGGHTPAFWPWMQILGALEVHDDRAAKLGGLDTRADASARLALLDAVVAFVTRRSEVQPLALLFDDVHATDPSSLHLIEYMLPLLPGRRVLLALASRDSDATTEIAAALGRVQRRARRLPLARLGRDDVGTLVSGRADPGRVFELSEGNPLFVEELLASVAGSGELRLPALSSVREVIRERVGRISAHAREALVAGAVVGREFRGAIVAAMVAAESGAAGPEPAIGARVRQALQLGMVAMTAPDRYRFSHALVAEAITDELDPSERARLHLHAAQAFERVEGPDASAIAHHLLAAGDLAAEAAVRAAVHAARAASAQLAFEDAAALLERAGTALQLAAPDDRKRRLELGCARAEALQHAGQHARAVALIDEQLPDVRSLGDPALLARIALARGLQFRFGFTDHGLVELLREALAHADELPTAVRARLLARLAAAAQPAPDPQIPVAHAREAIAMTREASPHDRLEVMYTAVAAMVDYVPPDELDLIHAEVAELARLEHAPLVAVHTQLRMCFTALERADRGAFEHARAAHGSLAAQIGLPRWQWPAHLLEALGAILDGRHVVARQAAARARVIADELADVNAQILCTIHEAFAASVQTRRLPELFGEAVAGMGTHRQPIRAWLAADAGDLVEARAALDAAGERMTEPGVAIFLVPAIVALDDASAAARVYQQIAVRSGELVLASMVGSCVADLYDRMLLVLATITGQWESIDVHAGRALELANKLGSPVWSARVRGDWAAALHKRDRPGDAARARELWLAVRLDAERFALPGLLARASAALGGAPPPTRARAVASTSPVTIARQGELWLVRGFGEDIHVRDSRGMQMLARLVAAGGRELHALDLATDGATVADGGDAGELLDKTARSQYRERLAALTAERDRAEEWGDAGRAERAGEEIEALTTELERAVGLDGRDRRAGAAVERARSNVQRRLGHALQQIRAGSRRLGEHFTAAVRTGTYCVYEP